MDTEDLSDLPEWVEDHFPPEYEEDNDDGRHNPTLEACQTLYEQWRQVMFLLKVCYSL